MLQATCNIEFCYVLTSLLLVLIYRFWFKCSFALAICCGSCFTDATSQWDTQWCLGLFWNSTRGTPQCDKIYTELLPWCKGTAVDDRADLVLVDGNPLHYSNRLLEKSGCSSGTSWHVRIGLKDQAEILVEAWRCVCVCVNCCCVSYCLHIYTLLLT